jgi:O-antigen/teichoic acid export membrane protein
LKLSGLLAPISDLYKSKSARAALVYMTSTTANLVIPFLLLPVLTRYLEPSDYGRAAMFQSVVSIANTATAFALRYPLLRAFSVGPSEDRPRYLSSILAIVIGLSLVLVCSMVFLSGPIGTLTGLATVWTLTAVLTGMATTLYQCRLTVFQADNKSIPYAIFQNTATALNLALSVALIVGLGFNWTGRAIGVTFSTWAMTMLSFAAFYRHGLLTRPSRKMAKEALLLGAAAIPHAMVASLMAYADRFFLSGKYSLDVVGTYALAGQLGLVVMMFGSALNTALTPWAYRKLDTMKSLSDYNGLMGIAVKLVGGITVAAVLYYLAVVLTFHIIVPRKYDEALIYFPWLLGAAYFNAIYFVFVSPIFFYKKTKILAASGMFNLVFSMGMFFVLSEYFGPMGVAVAMCGARFILFATSFIFGVGLIRQKRQALAAAPAE